MRVLQGGCYSISTCSTPINTMLTAYQAGNTTTTTAYAWNDDNGPLCSGDDASINIVPNFTDFTRVQVSQSFCRPGGTQSIIVRVRQNNNLSITSSSADMCQGQTRTLTATPARANGGSYSAPNSGARGDFSGTGVSGTTFTAPTPSGASQVYTVTYTFGFCTRTQNIRVYRNPTTANAGANQTVLVNSATLAANTPSIGTGTWSVVIGSGTFANANSPTTTVSNLGNGTNVFQWTITNGPCTASSDAISVTFVADNTPPTVACPSNQTGTFNTSCQYTIPDFRSSTLVGDNVDPNPTLVQSPAPGTVITGSGTTVNQTITMTATDNSGNVGSCTFTIAVSDVTNPSISCPGTQTGSFNSNCQFSVPDYRSSASVSDNCTPTGSITVSQSPAPGALISSNTTVTLTATDLSGNSRSCNFALNLSDNTAPNAVCRNVTVQLNSSGAASVTASQVNNGSSDNCTSTGNLTLAVSPSSFNCSDIGNNAVTLTVTDQAGNASTCGATVTVQDNVNPTISCPGTQSVNLNASCQASLPDYRSLASASDNCGSTTISQSPSPGTTLTGVGTTTVTLTANDGNGNTASCNFSVTRQDVTDPVLSCPGTQTVNVNGSCSATVPDFRSSVSASDNCSGSVSLSQSPAPGSTVNGTGTSTITITGNDGNGNTSTCSFALNRVDNTAPNAVCRNLTVYVNASGNASITASALNNGSSDNCTASGSLNLSASPSSFNCSNLGGNTVTLTVTDQAGNSGTCTGTVTVLDSINPTVSCTPATVFLNSSGAASLSAAQVLGSSNDNCGIASQSVSPNSFSCTNVGSNSVTLTVADNSGNTASCNTAVTVQDTVSPSAVCQDVTVQLNASGSGSISANSVNNGSSDACGISSISVSPSSFNCGSVGSNTVTLTVNDVNGNNSNCTSTVTVQDNIAPNAVCQNTTVQLNGAGTGSITASDINNGSTDNCSVGTVTLSQTTFNCASVGNNAVTLTVNDVNGNSSTCSGTVTVQDNVAPTAICQDVTVSLNGSGAAAITAGSINNGSSDACGIASVAASPTSFNCSNVGTNSATLTVTDNNTNSSTCTGIVTVQDNTPPNAVCRNVTVQLNASGNASITASDINNGSTDNCGIASLSVTPNSFTCANVGANTVTLTVTDVNGNSSTCTGTVTVQDNIAPTAVCQNATVQLNASGTASITASDINNGSSDNCGVASLTVNPSSFNCADVGSNTVTLTVTDVNGNVSTCTGSVTVEDMVAPTAVCQNTTVQLSASGTGSITASDINNGSSDNCGLSSVSVTPSSFTCANVGANTVTLTVNDVNGNSSSCTGTVTVQDNVAPNAVCQDVTVQLSASGNASITAGDINNGSSDNCGIASVSVAPTAYTCANVGANTATLTVTDVNGNSSTCTGSVTVQDNVPPSAVCQNLTVQLSASGSASITAADLDNGSADNCGIGSLSATPTSFGCANVGSNTSTLTVTDVNGNSSTCTGTVTVQDNAAPNAVCQNLTVHLSASGNATITAGDIDNGSSDNCSVASISAAPTSFTCANVGNNTVTLTVTDVNSNTSTCTGTVSVQDTTKPSALCQNLLVYVNGSGNATITAGDIDNGSSDNCGVASITAAPTSFTCANVGTNTTTLTVTDVNGNSSTCTGIVTVQDTASPSALCQNITVDLNSSGSATITSGDIDNGSSDNCGIASLSATPTSFNCANVGANTSTLTVTDVNGNTASCTSTVTVRDTASPTAACQNLTVYLGASGNATITAGDIDNGSSDNCGVASITAAPTSFTCANVGNNTVTLTVNDVNGNSSTCTGTVSVQDTMKPSAVCQNLLVYLDNSGNATITAGDVDNGSSDNCGVASISAAPTSFTCANVGTNTTTLTVTDVNGNSSTCTGIVTVQDTASPTAVCQNITVDLNSAGSATITAADIDNGSSDNCGVASLSATPTSFGCANVGANTSTLTVTDVNGNTASCTSTVTVRDTVSPTAICQDLTVQLSASGNASITAADIDNGSSDNCAVASISATPTSFTCANVGANTVTLTVNDVNGNSSTCTGTVTVQDNIAPNAVCQNVTVQLNGAGTASITAADIDNGSSDNCGLASVTVAPTTFTCANVGSNTVTLTVTDVNSNTSTCTGTVTVEDTVPPTAVCQNITVQLNGSGSASITAADVDNGSADNCGIASLSVSPTSFTCANVGSNTVTLTVTDVNGNSSTCTGTVTVEDTIPPTAVCQNVTVQLNGAGTASITAADIDNGSSDNCAVASISATPTSFTCANVGANTVTLTVTDVNGNSSTCTGTVTVEDTVPPTAVCQNVTVQLNGAGTASITAGDIDNGSSDNCGLASVTVAPTSFTCANVGANTVTLTVTDVNSNTSCTATVTVEDTVPPTAVCQNVTVQLNGSGTASITAGDVDNGSADNCGIASLSVTPNSFTCSNVGSNTVTLTVADVNGNSSTCTATVTVEDTIPPTAVCQNVTVQLDGSGSASITAADIDNGSSDNCAVAAISATPTSFTCANTGSNTVTLTVTDVNGNSSTCTGTVTVEDTVPPAAICQDITVQLDGAGSSSITGADVDGGSTDNCSVASLSVTPSSFNCANVGTNTVTLTVVDPSSNSSTCTATVTVEDTVPPTAVCQDITVQLDGSGLASITAADVNNGSSDNCAISSISATPTSFNCSNLGSNTVTLTVNDVNGNTSTCTATVTVEDTIPPTAVCQNITVQLDGAGNASITANDINNGSIDNCALASINVAPTSFNCANVGSNTVTLTVADLSGNSATCTATVTVEDTTAPTAVCQNITVQLDGSGNTSITAADIDNGSSDECSIASLSVNPNSFTCANVGSNTVTLTVADPSGNSSTCTATVTVEDTIPPSAVCQDITVQLDGSGSASITAADVDNGSADNCSLASLSVSPNAFTCAEVGGNTVTLTVNDVNGNTSTCTATVTVEDTVPPVAICQDITVQLDPSGLATITAADVDNGSNDNCAVASIAANPTFFNCTNVGTNSVILTVTDVNGNTSTCTSIVTVEDTVPPIANCQDVTVHLDGAGSASITANDINNGSVDNCAISTIAVAPSTFGCAELGANTVTLTVTDNSGNSHTCNGTVTVLDTISPVAVCQDITVQLDASGNAMISASDVDGGSSDVCGVDSLNVSPSSFNCSNVGANTVTLMVLDGSGNDASCTATVTVEDTVPPVAVCQDITVQLDPAGNAMITAGDVDGGSSDACGIASLSVTPSSFNCANVGANTVTLSVTDVNNNNATCTATVTVEDTVPPVAVCQNITVQLDGSGSASITAADIDNGSNDACGIASLFVNPSTFGCADVGMNAVTLTVTDVNGNISTCTGMVTVEDTVPPIAVCQDITVQLDGSGSATITAADIDNGSNDNCAIASLSVTPTAFSCSNVGSNTVTLTATDVNGNSATCTATVTVEDTVPPVAICQDITVQLDASGDASITAADVDNGSNDACGIDSLSATPTNFNCSNVGANTVTLTATDVNGNTATCTATVTVEDTVPPVAICQNITVQLDAAGGASIVGADVDNGSNDACGIDSLSVNPSSFSCANVGMNTVTLTVTDVNGNTSTCTGTVTVEDTVPPVAVCQDVTVDLDATGSASLAAGSVDNGSTDACGVASLAVSPQSFTCAEVGANTVTLTVTDVNGNSSTCTATATVEDNISPTAVCQDITVQLDATGSASITASDIDNGSSDNCAVDSLSIAPSVFSCSSVGTTVSLMAWVNEIHYDNDGTDQGEFIEIAGPAGLDLNGWSVALYNGDNGSVYNTLPLSGVLANQSNGYGFSVVNLPTNGIQNGAPDGFALVNGMGSVVEFLSYEGSFNAASGPAAGQTSMDIGVSESGTTPVGQSLQRTGTGFTGMSFNFVAPAAATSGSANTGQTFTAPVSGVPVTLTVTDVNGNSSTCVAGVTVLDTVPPVAICQDITVQLDASGDAAITAADIDNGSSDACGIDSLSITPSDFTCSNVGANTVTLTATDVNGNSATCTSTVTVEDTVPPVAVCQDITVQLDASGDASITAANIDNGSSDACGIDSLSVTPSSFNCANVGANTVTLTATDVNGNSATCTSTVTVEDTVPPVAICQDITVQLDVAGSASITATDIDGGSNDACGIDSLSIAPTTFSCADVGTNTVTLTATDVNGNSATCTSTVTVEDTVPPVAVCQNINVQLDASGNASITAADVDNGSSDACGIDSLSVTPSSFTCANVGANTVTLTATDVNGNSATCTGTVTVEDTVPPVAICQDITVQLDASGAASIAAADVDNGSNDACGFDSLSVTPSSFNCSNVGANTVTLTVTDVNGNTATCTATVTVEDTVPPVAICQDVTTQLNSSGIATITATSVDNGSNDACGIASLVVQPDSFTCADLGGNLVTLTVTDVNGNVSTCTATATVEDNVAPTAVCVTSPVIAQVDTSGNVMVTASQVDNGSFDNCSIVNFSLSETMFNCSDLGSNSLTLTVTDQSGNVDSCTATIQVEDTISPVLVNCPVDTTLGNTPANCGAIVFWTSPTATDNCSVSSVVGSSISGQLFPVGTTTVTYVATDGSGNTSSCDFDITVIDTEDPVINNCPANIVQSNDPGQCGAIVGWAPPVPSDNCPGVTMVGTSNPGTFFNVGTTLVTYVATDQSGNTDTCTFSITVQDTEVPVVSCPASQTVGTDTNACSATISGLIASVSDNCGIDTVFNTETGAGNDASGVFGLGTTSITFFAVDSAGNQDSCTVSVTVVDDVDPVLVCPSNVTVSNDSGQCAANVSGLMASASDNCGIQSVTNDFNAGGADASGSYPVGTTTVVFTATDSSGNTTTCSVDVTVNDTEAPDVVCPADITVSNDPGLCGANVSWPMPSASDNCGIQSITSSANSGDFFPTGSTTVTVVVVDSSGNSDSCSFVVTVNDTEPPVVTCPFPVTGFSQPGQCGGIVSWFPPATSDNCGVDTVVSTSNPGDFFPVGVTTVTYVVTDLSGNADSCSFDVTVTDIEDPDLTCPVSVNVSNDSSLCGATVSGLVAIATDNCGIDTVTNNITGTGDASGFYPVGTTTVTFTASDTTGNTESCSFTVTVNDTEAPVLTCPADVVVSNIPNSCSGTATWSAATATDNCVSNPTVIQTGGSNPGSIFPVGSSTITYTAFDNAGNSATCSFQVIVQDTQAPVLVCPVDIVTSNDPGQCDAVVNFTVPVGTDNCPGVTTVQTDGSGLTSGSTFPLGTTTLAYEATDGAGNVTSCSFNVTVEDNEAPVLACPTNTSVFTTDSVCGAVVNYVVPTATDNCTAGQGVVQISGLPSGSLFPVGSTINTFVATDSAGNSDTCTWTVDVSDTIAPVLTCPTSVVVSNDTGQCNAVLSGLSASASDACGLVSFSNDFNGGTDASGSYPVGITTVTFTATDSSGNTSTCSFDVTVNDVEAPVVNCPASFTQSTDPGLCEAVVFWTNPTSTDNCNIVSDSTDIPNGSDLGVGTTTITYTAVDSSGNATSCTFDVTIEDNEAPVIVNCPSDITQDNDPGVCQAIVSWNQLLATDNCTLDTLISNFAPDDTFAVGTTTVIAIAIDTVGNSDTCSFNITVLDIEDPVITCPANIVVSNDTGACGAAVTFNVSATDQCSIDTIISSNVSGDFFPIGTTVVNSTAFDPSGNSDACSFTVTVNDTEAPMITCPTDIVVPNDSGQCAAVVTFPTASASDNCGIVSVTPDIASGSVFPVGTTPVTFTAVDSAGNSSSCTFNVTVNDTEAPMITCPANIVQANDTGLCAAVVTWMMPMTNDNCGIDTVISTAMSGDTFIVGPTTVAYLVTDLSGNIDSCSFTVTVNDTEAPMVTCPANIVQVNDTGQCGAAVSFPLATATDNCAVDSIFSDIASGSFFPVGTTTVTFQANDVNGNSDTCTFTVTVNDTEAPMITCPTDIVVPNDSGQCAAVVTFPTASASDNCGIVSVTPDIASGSVFPVGTTPVTFTAVDSAGNSSSCTFNVTVNDTEAPMITCPANIVQANDTGLCAAVVTWMKPMTNDNCGIDTVISTAMSGDTFTVGTTTVSYQVTDLSGNIDSCSFTVTVNDTEAPMVTCPANIVQVNDTSQCGAAVSFPLATATDNCAVDSIFSDIASGSFFPVGTTTVTFQANDVNGNSDTCTFTVTVNDTEAPMITCPTDIVVPNDSGQCAAVVTFPTASASDNCGIVSVTPDIASGSVFPVGTTPVTFTVVDSAGNSSSCTFNVTVNDTEAPMITCPANIVQPNDTGLCAAVVTWMMPMTNDNCGIDTVISTAMSGDTFIVGTTTVSYLVTDLSGNTDSCSFTVTVNDTEAPMVTCPANIVQVNDTGQCGAAVSFPLATATDNCAVDSIFSDIASGSFFPVGTTTVTFQANDVNGNSDTCTFTVTVNDTEAPMITCPTDIVVPNDSGQCAAVVTFPTASASDNCGIASVTPDIASGSVFPVGTTPVTFTAVDSAGNSSSCTFNVTVNDTEAPMITCPANIVQANDTGLCAAVVTWMMPTTNDNCGVDTVISTAMSGDTFIVGTTTVSYLVTDLSGNIDSCSFTVTVNDTEAPTIVCPSDITVANDSGQCSAVVTWALPTVSDNCGIDTLIGTSMSGDTFPVGVTLVTYIVSDVNGNSETCSFSITVEDQEAPMITCPANITVSNDTGQCSAVVTWPMVTATDNCLVTSVVGSDSSGSVFPVGTSVVSFVAMDQAGNVDSCSFTVTVNDTEAPVASCPVDTVIANDPGLCSAVFNYAAPSGMDNCGVASIVSSPASGSTFPVGVNAVSVVVTDSAGNSDSCSFNVTVLDTEAPVVTCPVNIAVNSDPGQCGAIVNWNPVTASDNCGVDSLGGSSVSGDFFPVGLTTVTFTATDSAGNIGSCDFDILVSDNEPPVVTCPPSIVQDNDPGICGAVVTWPAVGASDNCGIDTLIGTAMSGDTFPVGVTNVTFIAVDDAGLTDTCSFTVTVIDTEAPVVVCPADIVINNDTGQCAAAVTWNPVTATDNCAIDTLIGSAMSGDTFSVGSHVVTFVATDVSGNADTCSFNIDVIDNEAPVVFCPVDTVFAADSTTCSAVVGWNQPLTSDNCSIDTIFSTLQPGTSLPVGTVAVTYFVEDPSGKADSCSFNVTVEADSFQLVLSSPVYGCGFNISCAGANNGLLEAEVQGGCEPYSYVWSTGDTAVSSLDSRGPGFYSVTVTDGLGTVLTDTITLTQPQLLTAFIVGDTAVCEGDSTAALSLVVSGGHDCAPYIYDWNTGDTTDALMGLPSGGYAVTVTDTNGCAFSDSVFVSERALPVVNLGNDTTICPGAEVNLEAGIGFAAYDWSTGDTTPTITVDAVGDYSVTVTDVFGCQGSDTLVVSSFITDDTLIDPRDGLFVCQSDSIELTADPGYVSYLWSTGDTTESVFAMNPGGAYSVTVTDSNGCQVSDTVLIDFKDQPNPEPIIIPGPQVNLCIGDVVVLDAAGGYFTYDWNTGDTTETIKVSSSGRFVVTVTNGFGCPGVSDTVTVTQVPLPTPGILLQNDTLFAVGNFASYQWNRNGNLIPGAILNFYVPQIAGAYSVTVQDSNGCEAVSDSIVFDPSVSAESATEELLGIDLYPNPTSGIVNVRTLSPINWDVDLTVMDMYGHIIRTYHFNYLEDRVELDLTDVANGMYLMRIEDKKGRVNMIRFMIE